jgi:hypothetical protein
MSMGLLAGIVRTVSDYTIGTVIVLAHVVIAARLTRAAH